MKLSALAISLFCVFSFQPGWAKEWAYKDIDGTWKIIDSKDYPQPKVAPEHIKANAIASTVTYLDTGTGFGFDDPTLGAARKATIDAVLQYIGTVITNPGALDVEFQVSTNTGTGFLAFAGPFYPTSTPGFFPGTAFEHITTGIDPDNAIPDIRVTVNFGYPWNSEVDNPGPGEYDLFSVMLHELTHGLGILSNTNSTGASAVSGGNPGVFTTFDDLLQTGNGKDLWTTGGTFNGTASDLTGGDAGVFYSGANAVQTYGSKPPIYTPAAFAQGSSISHWATSIAGGAVMVPSISIGTKKRIYAQVESATFKDLGYQVSADALPTPTPTTPIIATPTPSPVCKTYFTVKGDSFDPENDVFVDLYMETLEKFLAVALVNPADATSPTRIRGDALSIPAYISSPNLPPVSQTLELTTGIFLPEGHSMLTYTLDCSQLQLLVNDRLLLFGTPYIILAVYTDNVPRSPGGNIPPQIMYYGTFSPGTFEFKPSDFDVIPTPTQTGTPSPTPTKIPTVLSMVLASSVDPVTESPIDPTLAAQDLLDILWVTANFLPAANLTLYFDRDDMLQVEDMNGTVLRTIRASDVGSGSSTLSFGEKVVNNGIEGLDFGAIDLTVDSRFPPPPPTGHVDVEIYPQDFFRWDFSQIPAGRYFLYGILDNTNGKEIVDYAPYPVRANQPRWPVLVGDAINDRFVHGVAIHDVVTSASELDVVAIAQSGLFRVYDFLGRPWTQYSLDLNVTIDTAPAVGDIDGDPDIEIVLGTDQLKSDENPVFSHQNAVIAIDSKFPGRYQSLMAAVAGKATDQAHIESLIAQNHLTNAIHFLPPGQAVFATPAIRDIEGDGKPEVVVVTRPFGSEVDSIIETLSFISNENIPPVVETAKHLQVQTTTLTLSGVAAIESVTINGIRFKASADTNSTANRLFSIAGTDAQDAAALADLIDNAGRGVPGVRAIALGSVITLVIVDPSVSAIDIKTLLGNTSFIASTGLTGPGTLGEPAVGNLTGDPKDLWIVLGSETGRIYAVHPDTNPNQQNTPILTLTGPTLRAPALVDTNGDGIDEILIAISERDRAHFIRTELHYLKANGQPVSPFASTRIFKPSLNYDSLSTPVVSRLFPAGAIPAGFSNDLVAMFATRNSVVGINLSTGVEAFSFTPAGSDFGFGSSSPVIGQTDPAHNSFEIVMGGGRDTHGNLFGWYFNPTSGGLGQLVAAAGFSQHQEPRLPGEFSSASILGSPEMADLDGNLRTDVVYTNEDGFINRFEAPVASAFSGPFELADFPWPSFKHDQQRTGSASARAVPIQPFQPGDLNRDGVVDENDLFLLSKSWAKPHGFDLRRGALGSSDEADDGIGMSSQGFLMRVIQDLHK
jgi:hypothetical protein